MNIQFNEQIIAKTSFIQLHFITIFEHSEHERTVSLKKLPYHSIDVTRSVRLAFNILFTQILHPNHTDDYYLAIYFENDLFLPNIFRHKFNPNSDVYLLENC
jgi:hypothetical protein